ncbi:MULTISPECIES: hypothetical protein [unclassified Pseudoalteromonas]|uniref:hypothetical protein n=1 Tax=unclassified Pseudoalteromonas TaxID=194690 RepID=UPI0025B598A7|nr:MULTISPECIES: hypothetical protein [unclassified Pseudoalteromonas]MDN3377960.1 hypothetical protein [Pseudoalteromonas sp. APC 3893]MDN3386155.1 hypothetical protein [Pseudoalteromonas sp. APC 4017]
MFKSEFHKQYLSLFGYDYAKGAKELGVSERQIRRYLKAGKASKPVEKLLNIIYRGYLPDFGAWADCKISIHDHTMITPWGIVRASDVQLVHRYKWSARESESMYKKLKLENKTQDKYLSDLQYQLLEIIGDISERTGS